ncbi:hypothetical protein L6164_014386 [Bauhinia variegata]|uniref:Uncharacterized protein n=1 Tax=Bauhinia variegata TaxID=167791 RepID=A0ACB9NKV1_BAUVA|nr:hypothetical protein L6164_014386 [Bauhinia variegata]
MQRSCSISRSCDEFSVNLSATALGLSSSSNDNAVCVSEVIKKENAVHRKSQGENAIHLIPLVLIVCAFILWIFSYH